MVCYLLHLDLLQVRGAFAPVFELQARVFLEALVGNIRLPDRYGMTSDIEAKKVAIGKRFKNSSRHTIQVGIGKFASLTLKNGH